MKIISFNLILVVKYLLIFLSLYDIIMFMKQIMLKNFLLIVIVMQILPIFAQKKYTSADGFYGYNFSEDFTQMSSTIIDSEISIDNSIENQTEITHLRKSIIPFWKIGSIEYIYFESDFYFILQNLDKQFIFVKEGKWTEYWKKNIKSGIYEATSEQKNFLYNYDVFNLSQFNFDCWISNSQNSTTNECITIETDSKFSSFRLVNGYIDFLNPENFESYSRVKTLKAYDENNNHIGTFNFKDNCSIQNFYLQNEVSFIRFEITDTYSGSLYDDVALTVLQCY